MADESNGLEHDDEQRQPHGELREQIVIGDGEGEMQAVEDQRVHEDALATTQHDT